MLFTVDRIRERLRTQPFEPMRIVTTTGQGYDVHQPDQVAVGRRQIMVGIPLASEPYGVADQFARVALEHIVELRDLPQPVSPANNGLKF